MDRSQRNGDGFMHEPCFLPTLGWNMFLGRILKVRRWWDYIDPHVMVGAYPFARDVEALYPKVFEPW